MLFVAAALSFSLTAREFFDNSIWHVHAYFWNRVNPPLSSLLHPPAPSLSWPITLSLWLFVMMVWCRPCPWLTVCGWEHLERIKNGWRWVDEWTKDKTRPDRCWERLQALWEFLLKICVCCACVCSCNLLLPVSSMTLCSLCRCIYFSVKAYYTLAPL